MGNLRGNVTLAMARVSKGQIDRYSLKPLFNIDNDFTENVEYFREDTLELGFNNEADRVSKEIWDKHKDDDRNDEVVVLNRMVRDVFDVPNFIGQSSNYGNYEFEIIEFDFEYLVVIGVVV
jgi:hypothetical protein